MARCGPCQVARCSMSSCKATSMANCATPFAAAIAGPTCLSLRVRVIPRRMYAYPDVTVVCGKPLLADERQDILVNPTAIFEVLSPTTEKYDRGTKFRYYLTIDTLKDYILVDQFAMRIEQYTRGTAGAWTFRAYQQPEDQLKIDSIGVSLPARAHLRSRRTTAAGTRIRIKTRWSQSTYSPARSAVRDPNSTHAASPAYVVSRTPPNTPPAPQHRSSRGK